jgi:hypothetical protein
MADRAADKLHARGVKLAHRAVGAARQYLDADATGCRVLASVVNLVARGALLERAAASPAEGQAVLGHLLQFDGIAGRLVARHREEVARAADNVVAVVALLRECQDGLRDVRAELHEALTRGPPQLAPAELTARTPVRPLSFADLLAVGDAVAAAVAYDVTCKLAAQAAVGPAGARLRRAAGAAESDGSSIGATGGDEWDVAAAEAAARLWPSPLSEGAPPPPEEAGGGSTAAGDDPHRAALWRAASDAAWRLTGRALGEPAAPQEVDSDHDDDDDDAGTPDTAVGTPKGPSKGSTPKGSPGQGKRGSPLPPGKVR